MIKIIANPEKDVDHTLDQFPEEDFLDFKTKRGDLEFSVKNYRYQNTVNPDQPKAVLYFLHGFGSWTGKYGYYAKHLAEAGYDVVGFDLPGFGKTKTTTPGHLFTFDELMGDAEAFLDLIQDHYGAGVTFGLIGYSLGGGMSFTLMIRHPGLFKVFLGLAPYAGF